MSKVSKNGMRPVHPGEVLREDFTRPLGLSANDLAKALNVPAPRINHIVRGRRGSRRIRRGGSVIDDGAAAG